VTSVNDDVSHDINVSRVLRSVSVYDVSYDDDISHKHHGVKTRCHVA